MRHYIADLIMEFRIQDEPLSLIHRNSMLVFAPSAEEAYAEALALGAKEQVSYVNTDGKNVDSIFRGAAQLCHIHEPLEHGSELRCLEVPDATEERIKKMILSKDELSAMRELKTWSQEQ